MENTNQDFQNLSNFNPTTDSSGGNKGLKIITALLAVLLIGGGIAGYSKYKSQKETEARLIEEKQNLINDLEELKVNYENVVSENSELKSQVEDAKKKVEDLIAELKKVKKADAALIRKYKNQIYALRKQRDKLFKMVDSLKEANQMLAFQKDSLGQELQEVTEYNEKVLKENEELSKKVNIAKTLAATFIHAHGVKIKKSGKIVETRRSRRADQIKVCTTLPANPLLEPGQQVIYVQVVNPKGEVIGSKDIITLENGEEKIVSASKEFTYDGLKTDVCLFVIPQNKEDELVKGEYMITFFHNGRAAGTSNFTLK